MPKRDTIENRVYLFDSLASAFVAAESDRLCSENEEERTRALRALADLARVSCVVADSGGLTPEAVRDRILEARAAVASPPSRGNRRPR